MLSIAVIVVTLGNVSRIVLRKLYKNSCVSAK